MSERDPGEAERVRIELRELAKLQAEVRKNKMSERVTAVLTEHQRQGSNACLCGWSKLGHSFPAHQAEAVESILFSEEAIERAAEVAYEAERAMIDPLWPEWANAGRQSRKSTIDMIHAVVAALRGEA